MQTVKQILDTAAERIETILMVAAKEAYRREIILPKSEQHLIGEGKEFLSKEEWLKDRIELWALEAD